CFFFFSSRRRHTRFSRDWSSDVCSSDLNHNSISYSYFFFRLFITGTPRSINAAAFKCCSYWFFIGIARIFFPRYKASAGVSKPAPHSTPDEEAILLIKRSLLMGCILTFL